jgi:hypothetical protein
MKRVGGIAVFGFSVALSLVSNAAHASAGVDVHYAVPPLGHAATGYGVGLRFGEYLHAPFVELTPEVGTSYTNFADLEEVLVADVGARLGVGELARVGGYAHVGGGYDMPRHGPNQAGLFYDAGMFLNATVLPLTNIGFDFGYRYLVVGDWGVTPFRWATIGVHMDMIF